MTAKLPIDPGAVAGKAREIVTRVRPGPMEARRSLAIRRPTQEIRELWDEPGARATVLDGIPVAGASLDVGAGATEWGTTVTLELRLDAPVPGMAAPILAGKALRRLKSLAETGEVPTTERNPSARDDAKEETA